ncbi:hevamine-A-like [Prosopis cineraria]|uniref:hevamine-A-like n=1 Tax=Prosopis cineraria TaxID=364024 RepID=UPI00240FA89C|nr:hevamine-A-like [Prosopis cineraria]
MSSIIKTSHADDCPANIPGGKIAVSWKQNRESDEGSIADTCDSGLYDIVALAYLHVGQDGPLGAVSLDGINLANIDYSTGSWVDLVEAIYGYSTQDRKIYISASPRCSITAFDSALATASDSPVAASNGYISPEKLKSEVLPKVKESSNFGGVMIWNRYYDKQTSYSAKIKEAFSSKVCECVCHDAASKRFNSF